jgi:uncharacterized DUF497 family protein
MLLLWDDWNVEHIAKHGVEPHEAKEILEGARRPYPKAKGNGKYLVKGRTTFGRLLQVIYVIRDLESIDFEQLDLVERLQLLETGRAFYVIHARELRSGEARQLRRR